MTVVPPIAGVAVFLHIAKPLVELIARGGLADASQRHVISRENGRLGPWVGAIGD